STPHPALGEKSPAEVLMGRKLITVHEAMLPKKTLSDRKRERKKNGFAVNTPVYARDYRLGHQWTAAIIKKKHGSMIYDVVVLPPRLQVIHQVMVPPRSARTRWKPSRLQVDPSSKTYDRYRLRISLEFAEGVQQAADKYN
ncbi:hypothetical protein ACTXT7_014269, partial [Hymenolepis weldensis]